jgi:SHS2 domain-containing protein
VNDWCLICSPKLCTGTTLTVFCLLLERYTYGTKKNKRKGEAMHGAIKAVTYHGLVVADGPHGTTITVTLDL